MSESAGSARILVVDDDPTIRKILRDRFRALGHSVDLAVDGAEALALVEKQGADLVLLDLQMPTMDGFGVLATLGARADAPAVIVITAHGSIEAAVRAVRAGAADFVTKPFEAAHLEHVVAGVLEKVGLRRRVQSLETELSDRHHLVLGKSRAMAEAYEMATRAAASDANILLRGESGAGKEVLARVVHRASKRRAGMFAAINCAALTGELLASELFGHEKGAFTGAVRSKPGRIELAAGGTLFLDEIAEIAPALQAKLLRVIQEREYERVGGTQTLKANVRIIAATNRELPAEIAAGRFREDLYYRLNVVSVRLPPLRDRRDDVPALLDHFLRKFAVAAGRQALRFTPETREVLGAYAWTGNVRELANVVERAVVLSTGDELGLEVLPEEIVESAARPVQTAEPTGAPVMRFHEGVAEAKRALIREALRQTGGHQTRAAELLGLTQPYLARLCKNLGVRES
ncbi:MAG: sigma-54-dependent Fis family transcriptional regulator [Deltaproteobacteria bacterium]|nr:sigma-54-dependent Fis family transcriptional regulator [Deltaproteobacteria bacterium]